MPVFNGDGDDRFKISQDFNSHVDLPLQCTSRRGRNFDRCRKDQMTKSSLTISSLPPGMVGTIDQTCNILNVAEDAYHAASSLCDGKAAVQASNTFLDQLCKSVKGMNEKSRPGIPEAPKYMTLITNLQLNTSTTHG